jgi:hypothetical protein
MGSSPGRLKRMRGATGEVGLRRDTSQLLVDQMRVGANFWFSSCHLLNTVCRATLPGSPLMSCHDVDREENECISPLQNSAVNISLLSVMIRSGKSRFLRDVMCRKGQLCRVERKMLSYKRACRTQCDQVGWYCSISQFNPYSQPIVEDSPRIAAQ